jgi:predicted HTH domain antitoxin
MNNTYLTHPLQALAVRIWGVVTGLFMNIHLSTAKYNSLLSWKTYIHPGQGTTPGEGDTPLNAIKDWVAKITTSIEMYESKHISLGKFAEIVGISLEEAKQFLEAENISLDLGVSTIDELQVNIENA